MILGTGCDPAVPPEMPRLHLAFSYAGAESGSFEVVAERLPPLYGFMLLDGPIAYAEVPPGGTMALQARDPDHEGRGAALTLHLGGGVAPGVVPLLPTDPGPLAAPSISSSASVRPPPTSSRSSRGRPTSTAWRTTGSRAPSARVSSTSITPTGSSSCRADPSPSPCSG